MIVVRIRKKISFGASTYQNRTESDNFYEKGIVIKVEPDCNPATDGKTGRDFLIPEPL